MPPDHLAHEWRELSEPWIREMRQGRNYNRAGLLDPPALAACGDVTGLRVLDSGCGEGRFCRLLAEGGAAEVVGLDLCEPMIRAARELPHERIRYDLADVQNLSFLEDDSFDLAVSYLNQCDLPDFTANTREVHRVLRHGGRFVIVNLHPMRSPVGGWQKDEQGRKQHVMLDRYFDEGPRQWQMMGVWFTNFHRSLQTYLDSYLSAGFALERLVEPTVSLEMLAQYPELEDELRVPNFIIFVLRKPG